MSTTDDHHLDAWLRGEPYHLGEKGSGTDECCPDFSCCKPELLQPLEVRRAFVAADAKGRDTWLMSFLGAAMELATAGRPTKVHLAGRNPEDES